MAGGIDWFRWHHGSVTDPKFQLVARKAGARLSDVLAIWAYVLEHASAADVRGKFGDLDTEAIDCLFGFEDGLTASVLEQMGVRGLVCDGEVLSWTKRQPKREREDDSSTNRVKAFRERASQQSPSNADENQAEPCNATKRQETPRVEERREEELKHSGFASFWSAFPNKKAKADAIKAWSKLKPSEALQASILKALEIQGQGEDWTKEGGRFIPHPATWINARRWEDEDTSATAASERFAGAV